MTDHGPGSPPPQAGPGPGSGAPPAWPYGSGREAPYGLAVASISVAVLLALVEVGTAVAAPAAQGEFGDAVRAGRDPYDVFTLYDGLELLLFPVLVAAWVVSSLWLHFARDNTPFIQPHFRHQRRKIWVWLGWWVPIVSFWFPYQVVRDVQESSRRGRPGMGLGLWWTAWLVYICGNRVTARTSTSSDLDTLDLLTAFEAVTAVAVVVACVQWCRVVLRITRDQRSALEPG